MGMPVEKQLYLKHVSKSSSDLQMWKDVMLVTFQQVHDILAR